MTYNVTKEQIELFNQHFKIIEEIGAVLEYTMDTINPNFDINEASNGEIDEYLLNTNWTQTHTSYNDYGSDYYIQDKKTEINLKTIGNLYDIFNFIQNEMSEHLDRLEP